MVKSKERGVTIPEPPMQLILSLKSRFHLIDRRRRRRNRRHSTSDSESDSDKHRRHRDHRRSDKSDSEIVSDCDMKKTSETSEQLKSKPMIEEIVKPTVNKMTEDLRAKVRAMLENK